MTELNQTYRRRQRAQLFIVSVFAPKFDHEDLLTALTTLIDPATDFLLISPIDAHTVRYGPKGASTALEEFMKRRAEHADANEV